MTVAWDATRGSAATARRPPRWSKRPRPTLPRDAAGNLSLALRTHTTPPSSPSRLPELLPASAFRLRPARGGTAPARMSGSSIASSAASSPTSPARSAAMRSKDRPPCPESSVTDLGYYRLPSTTTTRASPMADRKPLHLPPPVQSQRAWRHRRYSPKSEYTYGTSYRQYGAYRVAAARLSGPR